MFGYVTLDRKTLCSDDARRYQAYRRTLAQSLRQRHGPLAQLALSHDLTFLDILLTDVYGDGRKAAPLDPRFSNGFSGYAEPGDADEWAQRLKYILSDKSALAAVRENCRRYVYRSWKDVVAEAEAEYDKLLR